MTIVKDPPRKPPGSTGIPIDPEVLPPITRMDSRRERPDEFGAPGFGNRAVYQGERSLVVDPPAPITVKTSGGGSNKTLPEMGITRREAIFLKALAGSDKKSTAWRTAFPKDRGLPRTIERKARDMYKSIIGKIGEDEIFEAMGIGKLATMEKLRQLKDATCIKAFIVPETGQVVEAGPYGDNTTQMNATKLLTQIHKMVPDEKGGGGAVVVNIVQYNPPGTPTWPGGGRA